MLKLWNWFRNQVNKRGHEITIFNEACSRGVVVKPACEWKRRSTWIGKDVDDTMVENQWKKRCGQMTTIDSCKMMPRPKSCCHYWRLRAPRAPFRRCLFNKLQIVTSVSWEILESKCSWQNFVHATVVIKRDNAVAVDNVSLNTLR